LRPDPGSLNLKHSLVRAPRVQKSVHAACCRWYLIVTVDDLLLEDGQIAPFSPTETSYAAMGRFGNVFLTSGEPDLHLEARAGEVARLWLTNTANTRVFNLSLPGARMKLVGGDSGRVEQEEFVEEVLVSPSERAVVDVLVDRPGELHLEHHTPDRVYRLATVTVAEDGPRSPAATELEVLRRAPELEAERAQLERWLAAPPDKVLALVAQMDDPAAMPEGAGPVTYACPMPPEVTSQQPGRCPKCGMKLLAVGVGAPEHADMDHGDIDHGEMDHAAMGHGGADGIEWEDDMVQVNRATTTATMHWRFLDRTSGADSPTIDWQLAAEGHPDHSWTDDLNQVAASMMASLERTLILLYRRHFEHYVLDVTVLRAEAALERAGLARRRPVRPRRSPSSISPATPS
jgi:hypothetical protein